MLIERKWAMPNKRTFQIPPIRKLIEEEKIDGVVIDPFPYNSKEDVFDYLARYEDNSVDFALVDPPYTKRQVSEHYKEIGVKVTGWHTSSDWTAKVRDEVSRVVKPGGKVITFGYSSVGMGKTRQFEMTRILMVCHGGDHYDTICTVEIKKP